MTPSQIGLWFACALGSTVFAATIRPTWRRAVVCAAAFVVAAGWGSAFQILGAALVAAIAAAGALSQLLYRSSPLMAALLAGLLAGTGAALVSQEGAHPAFGVVLFGPLPVVACVLAARRPHFAPPRLRDEALLLVGVVGLAGAVAPGLIEGWRAAVNLTAQGGGEPPAIPIPLWPITLSMAAVAAGALSALWSRR